tara:strand:- start:505 stop:765 length:261 start_codon:yes stop_codon:yes gene_type:complete
MLKIDKDIPIPNRKRIHSKMQEVHSALDVMEVGDSIEFPFDAKPKSSYSATSNMGARFYAAARRRGINLTSRRNNDTKTLRYWRVK